MALDVAAATALSFRLARSFDEAASRSRRGGVRARHDVGRQILGLQDRAVAALRGDGVPRRQRLRRGGAARPLLSRGAGQRHLGRLRQRHGARRAARAGARAGLFDDVLAGIEADLGAGRPRHHQRAAGGHAGREHGRGRRPASSPSNWRCRPPPPSCGASAPAASPTPSSRPGSPANGAPPTACSTPATTPA